MAVDFSKLLGKPLDSVERPKPLPAGTYYGSIKNFEPVEIGQNKTPAIRFNLSLASPGEDIDPNDLQGIDLSKRTMRKEYYLTPESEYRLKEFIASLGIQTAGRSFEETLPETLNQQVMIAVIQKSSQNGEEIFNNVDSVKAAA